MKDFLIQILAQTLANLNSHKAKSGYNVYKENINPSFDDIVNWIRIRCKSSELCQKYNEFFLKLNKKYWANENI